MVHQKSLQSVCIMHPIFLRAIYQEFDYRCWVSIVEPQVMKSIVNVSSDFSGGGTTELLRDLDAT